MMVRSWEVSRAKVRAPSSKMARDKSRPHTARESFHGQPLAPIGAKVFSPVEGGRRGTDSEPVRRGRLGLRDIGRSPNRSNYYAKYKLGSVFPSGLSAAPS